MEESISMFKNICEEFGLPERQLETYSPLSLAYLGDCVYELIIRTNIVENAEASVKVHSKEGAELAKAVTQAAMVHAIIDSLDEPELAAYKRGRNAHTIHGAKHATASEYRLATGFESLMGWLYVQGRLERICELVKMGWEAVKSDGEK